MRTVMISARVDENLLAEVDGFAAAKDRTRSAAIELLLIAGLKAEGGRRPPGWDAQAIAETARQTYGGMGSMFEAHGWPERGTALMPAVQKRVAEAYGDVEAFVEVHEAVPTQREYMLEMFHQHGGDKDACCKDYAAAEEAGIVKRKNNSSRLTSEKYAIALWRDGERRGWLRKT